MKYPCYRLSQGRTALSNYRDNSGHEIAKVAPEFRSCEGESESPEIYDVLATLSTLVSSDDAAKISTIGRSADQVEGIFSLRLYDELRHLPAPAVCDPDFWRYVAIEVIRDFVFWRDGEDCSQASFGLASGRRIPDCVPLRMFNRAHLARTISEQGTLTDVEICTVGGADFWQSHVLRVQNRFDPRLVSFLTEESFHGRIPNVAVLREVAKDIRQLRANLVLELQTTEQLHLVLNEVVANRVGPPR